MTATFPAIVGHPRPKRLLAAALAGTPGHAYLFLGPTGVGKRSVALAFARALNCAQRSPGDAPPSLFDDLASPPAARGDACGECRSCRLIDAGTHPDVRVIDRLTGADERRARAPKNISVEVVRAATIDATRRPEMGGRRVYIIHRADELSLPGFDALLKTLEEPASSVTFLLTAVDEGLIPPTIISRCQIVRFGPIPRPDLTDFLVGRHGAEDRLAERIARAADGSPAIALELLADGADGKRRLGYYAEAFALSRASVADRLARVEALMRAHSSDPARTTELLRALTLLWRDVVLAHTAQQERTVLSGVQPEVEALTRALGLDAARQALVALVSAKRQIDENVQTRMALELLLMRLPVPGPAS